MAILRDAGGISQYKITGPAPKTEVFLCVFLCRKIEIKLVLSFFKRCQKWETWFRIFWIDEHTRFYGIIALEKRESLAIRGSIRRPYIGDPAAATRRCSLFSILGYCPIIEPPPFYSILFITHVRNFGLSLTANEISKKTCELTKGDQGGLEF